MNENSNPDAEDLYSAAAASGSELARSSVYRTLKDFERVGLARRLQLTEKEHVFEMVCGTDAVNGHFVDGRSGKVAEYCDARSIRKRARSSECGIRSS